MILKETAMTSQDDNDEHRWNHPQCAKCWFEEWGISRLPHRLPRPEREDCCFCGGPTMSGIFRRVEPGSFRIPFCPDLTVDPIPILPEPRRRWK